MSDGSPPTRSSRLVPAVQPETMVDRLFAPVDDTGHKVLLGLVWFALQLGAVALGPVAVAAVLAPVAAVASLHAVRSWRSSGVRASRAVAGLGPLAMVAAAAVGTAAAGLAVLVVTAAALGAAAATSAARRRGVPVLVVAGTTVRAAVPTALVGIALVALTRTSQPAAAALVVLIAAYDAGHFLWGAGTTGVLEGRLAGIASGTTAVFAASAVQLVVEIPPFQVVSAVWVMGLLAVCLCPLGELTGSALLPRAAAPAPAVRRIDSLLLAAPAWALVLAGVS